MIDCTFSYIPICLILCVIFCVIGIYEFKYVIITILILLYIPIKFILDSESYEQCNAQQRKERIENDKQFLLNNLENGQCGDVCIKESNSKHFTNLNTYITHCVM